MGYSLEEVNVSLSNLSDNIANCRLGSESISSIIVKLAEAQEILDGIKASIGSDFSVNGEGYDVATLNSISSYITSASQNLNGIGSIISAKISDYAADIEYFRNVKENLEAEQNQGFYG